METYGYIVYAWSVASVYDRAAVVSLAWNVTGW